MEEENTYSISEAANIVGFKPHVIRFYEKEFKLAIPREENNRRYFTDKEVNQLLYIKHLKNQGINNNEIKNIFKDKNNLDNNSIATITSLKRGKNTPNKKINNDLAHLRNDILNILETYNYKDEISNLKDKIEELKDQLNVKEDDQVDNKEKDILLCENAKLKMKVKEKSYEIAELKDKLKREENKKTSILRRILRMKSASL